MAITFCLRIKNHRDGTTSEVAAEIPDDEWQLLLAFAKETESLAQTAFVRTGMPARCELDDAGKLVSRSPLPTTTVVREFLHTMRPFILTNEPWSYDRVTNILVRRLDHPLWRNLIKGFKRSFMADASQPSFTVAAGDLILNSEKALGLWLNGYEYHRDPDKRAALGATTSTVPPELSLALFLDILAAKAEAILELAGIVRFLQDGFAREEAL